MVWNGIRVIVVAGVSSLRGNCLDFSVYEIVFMF